jgi:hypothetical protein
MAVNDNKTFGASGTPLSNLPSAALSALGGRANIDAATEIARSLVPQREPVDPALLSLLFFSNLAAESSKPGATALGAAGTAVQSPVSYLLQDQKARREAEAKLPSTALSIANMLKPPKAPAGTGKGENFVKLDPVLDENGRVKYSEEGAPLYNYSVQDNAGNVKRKVILPDLTAAGAIKGVEFFNESGAGRTFSPGSEDFMGARDGTASHGYVYSSPPTKGSMETDFYTLKEDRTINGYEYKAGQVAMLSSNEAFQNRGVLNRADGEIKTVGQGSQAMLMSEADAEEFIKSQGYPEDGPRFDYFVSQVTAPNENLIGKPLVRGDNFQKVTPLSINGRVSSLQFSPITGVKPGFVTYRDARMKKLAGTKQTHLDNAFNVVPRIEGTLTGLLNGTIKTGMIQEKLLPFQRLVASAFGTDAAAIMAQEDFQALSFYLAPKMRPPGSGSTSDMEFKAYQLAIADLGKSAKANYVSLYVMKKMMEKGAELQMLEENLLSNNRFTSLDELNQALRESGQDKGLFEKYEGDPENQEEFDDWFKNLPKGAVIVNNGLEVYGEAPYLIKGWEGD